MKTKSLAFTLFLATLAAFPPVSTDMALPAQTTIGTALNANVSSVALTLGLFMLGYALAPLVAGPFADSYGRRRTLLWGSLLYTLASIACTFAPKIEWLLIARVVQGAGAGACSIMSLTIIRDLFNESEARGKLAQTNAIMAMAPIVGPGLGSLLLGSLGWRSIYAVMSGCGFLVFLVCFFAFKESFRVEDRRVFHIKEILQGYSTILKNRMCLRHLLVIAFSFGSLFAYISASSHVLMNNMHVSAAMYSVLFAISSVGLGVGAGISGVLSKQGVSGEKTVTIGTSLLFVVNVALFALSSFAELQIVSLMVLVVLSCMTFGIIAPAASLGVLRPVPDRAGSASAMMGFLQMTTAFAASAVVAVFLESMGVEAMSLVMLLCGVYALASYVGLKPQAEVEDIQIPSAVERAA